MGHCHPCPLGNAISCQGPSPPVDPTSDRATPFRLASTEKGLPCGPGGPCCLHDAIRARLAAEKKSKSWEIRPSCLSGFFSQPRGPRQSIWKFWDSCACMVDANLDVHVYPVQNYSTQASGKRNGSAAQHTRHAMAGGLLPLGAFSINFVPPPVLCIRCSPLQCHQTVGVCACLSHHTLTGLGLSHCLPATNTSNMRQVADAIHPNSLSSCNQVDTSHK